MKTYPLNLTAENKSETFTMSDSLNETHILIRIIKVEGSRVLNIVKRNTTNTIPRTIGFSNFIQDDATDYTTVIIDATIHGNGYVNGEVTLETWAETLLTEIDFSLERFFISYQGENSFTIGRPSESTLIVKPDSDGNFSVIMNIVDTPTVVRQGHSGIYQNTNGTERIESNGTILVKRLFKRIKPLCDDSDFMARQNQNSRQLSEHLEKRIRDGV